MSKPLSAEDLLGLEIPMRRRTVTSEQCIHYALSVGLAMQSDEDRELAFAAGAAPRVLPSMLTVIGFNESWFPDAGIDSSRVIHGSQKIDIDRPLPSGGEFEIHTTVAGVLDKGSGRGAFLVQKTRLVDGLTSEQVGTGYSTLLLRDAGGCGSAGQAPAVNALPQRAPDRVVVSPTAQNQALYFSLLGDSNPLHAIPDAARAAGFPRPIMHGACTYGIACATLLRAYCDLDPARLISLEARFVGPVFPGDYVVFLLWQDGPVVSFRAIAKDSGMTVLDGGKAVMKT